MLFLYCKNDNNNNRDKQQDAKNNKNHLVVWSRRCALRQASLWHLGHAGLEAGQRRVHLGAGHLRSRHAGRGELRGVEAGVRQMKPVGAGGELRRVHARAGHLRTGELWVGECRAGDLGYVSEGGTEIRSATGSGLAGLRTGCAGRTAGGRRLEQAGVFAGARGLCGEAAASHRASTRRG